MPFNIPHWPGALSALGGDGTLWCQSVNVNPALAHWLAHGSPLNCTRAEVVERSDRTQGQ